MSVKTINLIVFLVLLVHGVGHLQGVVSSAGVKFKSSGPADSWLLGGSNPGRNRIVCLLLYLVSAICGILAALSFRDVLVTHSIWTNLALMAAFFSAASLLLFPNALAMFFNKAGAALVNILIFYSILFQGNWPAAVFGE
jgi:hypothetical protein